ncbi:MAG: GH3 auxin-responsive promoter family protein, partial [Flavobacteriales bacterium]|nr:GH3 auxin-responsive promoter family protein [Flavobacteriales bacterium]
MSIKGLLAKAYAKYVARNTKKWASSPVETQEKVFNYLLDKAKNTEFGKDHKFNEINNFEDFRKNIPITDYEGLTS